MSLMRYSSAGTGVNIYNIYLQNTTLLFAALADDNM